MPHRRYAAVAAAALATAVAFLPTATAEPAADYPTDERGYSGSEAHCDDDQTLVEFGRTTRALVAICIDSGGDLEYRGVRLSDRAGLTMPATRAADGTITATNDGVTYAVTPKLIVVSEGDNVIYRDAWIEFRQPGFAESPTSSASPSTSESPSTSASTPADTSRPTVSTTTVTLTPTASS